MSAINPREWLFEPNAPKQSGCWRWTFAKKTKAISYVNIKEDKSGKKTSKNLEEIYFQMTRNLQKDFDSPEFHFSVAQLDQLKLNIEEKYQSFMKKHKGCCGCLYRFFFTPYIKNAKNHLIDRIDSFIHNHPSIKAPKKPDSPRKEPESPPIIEAAPAPKAKKNLMATFDAAEEPKKVVVVPVYPPINPDYVRILFQHFPNYDQAIKLEHFETLAKMYDTKIDNTWKTIQFKMGDLWESGISAEVIEAAAYFSYTYKQSEAFLRYLVLTDRILGFAFPKPAVNVYQLYLKSDNVPAEQQRILVTKDKLLEADKILSQVKWPKESDFSEEDLSIPNSTLKIPFNPNMLHILEDLYDRLYIQVLLKSYYPFELRNIGAVTDFDTHVIEVLAKKKLIKSWNIHKNDKRYHLLFFHVGKSNHPEYQWNDWKTIENK